MLGIVIGTLCLVGLFKVLRHGRYHRYYGFYGPHHYGHSHHWGHGRGFGGGGFGGRGGRRGGALRWLFWRLDTTHGQEKVIMSEVETLRETLGGLRGGMGEARAAAAALVRGEQFDADALHSIWRQQDAFIAKAREALEASAGRIHEALHADQRQVVARFIEEAGPRFGRC